MSSRQKESDQSSAAWGRGGGRTETQMESNGGGRQREGWEEGLMWRLREKRGVLK